MAFKDLLLPAEQASESRVGTVPWSACAKETI